MKKRVLSVMMALILCLGLAVPAFAADMTAEEGLSAASLEAVDRNGAEFDPGPQPCNLWLGHYDTMAAVLSLQNISSCVLSPEDIVFTVSNQGKVQDCYLIVHAVNYTPKAKNAAAEYAEDERSDDFSVVDTDTVYVGSTYWGGDYLCAGNVWGTGSSGAADEAIRIKVGQSVSFRLPDYVENGDFCRLYVDVYYPQVSGEETWFWSCYDLLIDNHAVSTEEPSTTVSSFTDVPASAYYADAVAWAVEKGITSGTGDGTTFSPNATCTTAQILTFLWRANGSPAPVGSNAAVPAGQYYTDAANWALEKGLTDTFSANTPCTRAATVTYLWKLAGKPAAEAAAFIDVDAGAEYAQAVAWAVKKGVTAGTSATTFAPDNTCTRGQIVTFLHRDLA